MTKKYHPLKKSKINKHTNKYFRFWHRKLGILSVVFVIMLSITGILINHSHTLSLDSKKVNLAWLLDDYGITQPAHMAIYQTKPLIASSDNFIWIKDSPPIEADMMISAIISFNDLFIAITPQQLYLISQKGQLLEQQDDTLGLPQDIENIGQDGQLWLKTANGYFTADSDLIEWTKASPLIAISWVEPLPAAQVEQQLALISLKARSTHLTWERVLLDVHSGRFFGPLGPWFMDLVAFALIIMSLTGIYLWQSTKKSRTNKRKNIKHYHE
ncbi:PepSY-associated TM helix domain-containing protein [Shewanella surugensis]|uniref:PepSY-associated TM helix domain-containing protein n=1 Tax=Shewanella surugensis TaxID=212020 RepID=A0ABT0LIV7_9GAMM|nr:PepSY-associated TM helix domain-containing protein [Shewanella surugensis]MCL1127524.1 PepSY-associated TM helix domain-containing protein [Shewanella surugensis]